MMLGKGCVFIFQKLMAAIPGAGMDAEFYEREEGRRGRGGWFSVHLSPCGGQGVCYTRP